MSLSKLAAPPCSRRSGLVFLLGLPALLSLGFALGGADLPGDLGGADLPGDLGGADLPGDLGGAKQSAATEPLSPTVVPLAVSAEAYASQRKEAVRLLAEARQACLGVRGYRCILATRERLRGRLLPEQVTRMVVRARPFAVRLSWLEPSSEVGQEVCYVHGANDGKMRVRPAGYLGSLVGVMALDPNAPAVRENSRHTITDAGLANMLERFALARENDAARVAVRVANSVVCGRECRRIEMVRPAGSAEWHRAMLHIERESSLPIRVEYYDRQGRLLDEATYRDLERNLDPHDGTFSL